MVPTSIQMNQGSLTMLVCSGPDGEHIWYIHKKYKYNTCRLLVYCLNKEMKVSLKHTSLVINSTMIIIILQSMIHKISFVKKIKRREILIPASRDLFGRYTIFFF